MNHYYSVVLFWDLSSLKVDTLLCPPPPTRPWLDTCFPSETFDWCPISCWGFMLISPSSSPPAASCCVNSFCAVHGMMLEIFRHIYEQPVVYFYTAKTNIKKIDFSLNFIHLNCKKKFCWFQCYRFLDLFLNPEKVAQTSDQILILNFTNCECLLLPW